MNVDMDNASCISTGFTNLVRRSVETLDHIDDDDSEYRTLAMSPTGRPSSAPSWTG
jgi:hypothetical protein